MVLAKSVAILCSVAAWRTSAQGPNLRNGDPLPAGEPFTDELKRALFKSGSHSIKWVVAVDYGNCEHACGELECREDMFEKVNSQHAFSAILESIDNAPGCDSYKVDTEYGVAPFIWEDEAQCWVSNDATGTTCNQVPDPQFNDVRFCPCKKEAGKDAAHLASDAVESSPEDQDAVSALGKEQALQGLNEVTSTGAFPELHANTLVAFAAAFAVVSAAGMMGVAAFRAHRQDSGARLLAVAGEEEGEASVAPSCEC